MLGQNSPLVIPGERRTKMGGMYASPNFTDLLESVAYMVLHAYTPTFTDQSDKTPPNPHGYAYKYKLDAQVIKKFILCPNMMKIVEKNATELIGLMFAHLSFNNKEVSEAVAEQILKSMNGVDNEKIETVMDVAKHYLLIDDELKPLRAEWVLGFPSLQTSTTFRNKLNKFGLSLAHSSKTDVHAYHTPINLVKTYSKDPLLGLLWRYVGKMDLFIVNSLYKLLDILNQDDYLAKYVLSFPPPNYNMARYTDWFVPFLENESEKNKANVYNRNPAKKAEKINKARAGAEELNKKAEEWQKLRLEAEGLSADDFKNEGEVIRLYPKPYVIGAPKEMVEFVTQEKEGVVLKGYKLVTEYGDSLPTRHSNEAFTTDTISYAKREADKLEAKIFSKPTTAGVSVSNLEEEWENRDCPTPMDILDDDDSDEE